MVDAFLSISLILHYKLWWKSKWH